MDKASLGFLTNLGVGAGILLFVALLFDVMRFFFPKNYYYRELGSKLPELNDYDGTPMYAPPRPKWYPFAWVKPVIMYPESDFTKTHGLDAALFVRFLRMQALFFSILSIYSLLVLFPLYGTAARAPKSTALANSTATNSTDIRTAVNTTAVNVTGIEIFSLSNVPAHDPRLWGTLVSEIVVLAVVFIFVLRELTVHASYRLAYRANSSRNPSNYAIIVLDIPPESRTPELIRRFFVRCFPGEVAAVHQVRDAENLMNGKKRIISAMAAREHAQYLLLDATTRHPDRDHHVYDDRVSDALQNQRAAEQDLEEMRNDLDEWAPVTHAAIVVFYTKRAATLACCTPLWKASNAWVVERAAEPRAVNWNRLEITSYTSLVRTLTTMGILFAFAAFWFFPITALQGLANLEVLSNSKIPALRFLQPIVRSTDPGTVRFVNFAENVLPPLLLFAILQLIPMLFRFIIGYERIPHMGSVEGKVRSYLFLFYVMSNFVFVVFTGSVLKEVEKLIKNPNEIFFLLSTTVPQQATFLMKYVLINSFLGSAMGLLNIGRLLIRPILVWRARTTRQKRGADSIFAMYPLFKMHALAQMISLISIIYSTIAPLICLVAVVYFTIAYICTKHTIMYSHRAFFESGGHLYPGSWYAVLVALYMHQLVLVGIFTFKRSVALATIGALTLLLTIGFTVYCLKRFYKIARNGSLIDQLDADDKAGLIDRIPEHFPDLYIHPGMKPMENTEDLTGLPRALRSTTQLSKSTIFPMPVGVAPRRKMKSSSGSDANLSEGIFWR